MTRNEIVKCAECGTPFVPPAWAEPIGDLLETYVPGKEKLSIKALAERTARLARV